MSSIYSALYMRLYQQCMDEGLTTQEARIYATDEMSRILKAYEQMPAKVREPVVLRMATDLVEAIKPVDESRPEQIVEDEDGWWKYSGS